MTTLLDQAIDKILARPEFDGATFDAQAFVAGLDMDTIDVLLSDLLAEEERRKFQKFKLLFPDDGPFRRELYPKHMEFFKAGAEYIERLFRAANRCVTPWTYIETPAGSVLSAELMTSTAPHVLSWDGEFRCVRPMQGGIVLGLEPAFRFLLGNGRFFDCNRRHRVLTNEGWLSVDRLMSRAGGLRLWHRHEDYQASCDADGHLGDQPLRLMSGIDIAPPPSRADVRQRAPLIFSLEDEAARKFQHIHACRGHDRLSSHDDLRHYADLFARFSGPASGTSCLRLSGYSLAASQYLAESSGLAPPDDAKCLDRGLDDFHVCALKGRVAACTPEPYVERVLSGQRSHEHINPHAIGGLSLRDERRTAMFFPSEHITLVGGERIISVTPLGYQPIIDAHVPGTNCYLIGGSVHHNTGKTVAGGFEVCCHMTGDYPHWWEGKRFRHPIDAWAAGDTNETTRDVIQKELFGQITWNAEGRKTVDGSGIIPREVFGRPTWKQGVQDMIDTIQIRHVSGGWSRLGLKSFDQGRRVFQGTAKHLIWLDEECPKDVYDECLTRTGTTAGILLTTFTPLNGRTEVVKSFDMQRAA